jgi:hypothetical protein
MMAAGFERLADQVESGRARASPWQPIETVYLTGAITISHYALGRADPCFLGSLGDLQDRGCRSGMTCSMRLGCRDVQRPDCRDAFAVQD